MSCLKSLIFGKLMHSSLLCVLLNRGVLIARAQMFIFLHRRSWEDHFSVKWNRALVSHNWGVPSSVKMLQYETGLWSISERLAICSIVTYQGMNRRYTELFENGKKYNPIKTECKSQKHFFRVFHFIYSNGTSIAVSSIIASICSSNSRLIKTQPASCCVFPSFRRFASKESYEKVQGSKIQLATTGFFFA